MPNLLSCSLFSGFHHLVSELGGNASRLLRQFQLPENIESTPEHYVSFTNAVKLFEYCATCLNCPDFGLRLSQQQGLPVLGPVAVLARNASTVQDALKGIVSYLHLISSAISVSFTPLPEKQCIRAQFTLLESGLFQSRQIYELYVGNGQLMIQMLLGEKVYAEHIYFPHSRLAEQECYRNAFRCEVAFNQDICAVDLPITIMQTPLGGADVQTANLASAWLAEHFNQHNNDLGEQVQHLIGRLLPTGQCSINTVAQQLNLHPRTLQRHLRQQELVFETLLDTYRQAQAKRYLTQSTLHLTQITGLLGYGDQSALNRACRRWFGQTPGQLRQKDAT